MNVTLRSSTGLHHKEPHAPRQAVPEIVGNTVQALGLGVIAKLADAQRMIRAAFPIREFKPRESATWARAYERFRRVDK